MLGLVTLLATVGGVIVVHGRTAAWVQHSRDVTRLAEASLLLALNQQTAIEGFLLTADPSSLDVDAGVQARIGPTFDSLAAATADSPVQHRRARDIQRAYETWNTEFRLPLRESIRSGVPVQTLVTRIVAARQGDALFDALRGHVDALVAREYARYRTRLAVDRRVSFGGIGLVSLEVLVLIAIVRCEADDSRVRTDLIFEQQERLQAQTSELHATFDQAAVGIVAVGADGRIIRANARACEITGYAQAELCTKSYQDITHPEDAHLGCAERDRLLAGDIESFRLVKRCVHKSGRHVWLAMSMSLVRSPSGQPDYYIAVADDITERRRNAEELQLTRFEVLERLAQAAEFRDDDTAAHAKRVGELAARTAEALGLEREEIELIRRAAPLHDVGKIGVPDGILLKPGPLTLGERRIMERHTLIGAQILAGGSTPLMAVAEQIARAHHERWDGTGYPHRAAGASIPLPARIVAIADFYDALTSERPYRAAWPSKRVLSEIERRAGSQFDPRIVRAFIEQMQLPLDDMDALVEPPNEDLAISA